MSTDNGRIERALDKVIDYGLLVLILVSPLVFKKGMVHGSSLPKLAFIQSAVLLLCFLWCLKGRYSRQLLLRKTPVALPMILFLTTVLLSLFQAVNLYEGMRQSIHLALCVILFFLVVDRVRTRKYLDRVIAACILSGAVVSIIGIIQYLSSFAWIPQVETARPAGTFMTRAMAVHFLVIVFPLSFLPFLPAKEDRLPWPYGVSSLGMIVYLIYTRSRAGWVACGFVVLFLLAVLLFTGLVREEKRGMTKGKVVAVLGAILLVVLLACIPRKGEETTNIRERIGSITKLSDSSVHPRLVWWRNTGAMIKDNLWTGVGIGNFKTNYPLYQGPVKVEPGLNAELRLNRAHNDYLQTASEVGIIGLLLYLWMLGAAFKMSWRTWKHTSSKGTRARVVCLAMGVAAFSINSFFSFPLQCPVPPLFLLLLIGLIGALYLETVGEERPVVIRIGKFAGGALLAGILIILSALTVLNARNIVAHTYLFTSYRYATGRNWEMARAMAERAKGHNPRSYQILYAAGSYCASLGRHREAIGHYQEARRYHPYHTGILNLMAKSYLARGFVSNAEVVYGWVLAINWDHSEARNNLGVVYKMQGRFREAIAEFKQVLRARPGWSGTHYNLACVYEAVGEYDLAGEHKEKARELGYDPPL